MHFVLQSMLKRAVSVGITTMMCSVPSRRVCFNARSVRVITLDVTGTLLLHRQSVAKTYADCVAWAGIDRPQSMEVIKKAFKDAYYVALLQRPCFGYDSSTSGREWWQLMARDFLIRAGYQVTEVQFSRFFTRLYQYYGSQDGYEILPDAAHLLRWVRDYNATATPCQRYSLGIITNTDNRTVDSILPMMDLHKDFDWFLCCQEIGHEKPSREIYHAAHEKAKQVFPDLKKEEMLHIGDNFTTDFCGARAAGLQALFLDRSNNERITGYQEWLSAPDYEGKCEEDIQDHTITSLKEVALRLQIGACSNL